MIRFLKRVFGGAAHEHVRGVHPYKTMQLRLDIERSRAVRANRNLSLLVLEYEQPLDPDGTHMAQLADRILQRLRMTDELGWLEQGQLGVILPDTTNEGAQIVSEAIFKLCSTDLPKPDCVLYFHPADVTQDETDHDEQVSRRGAKHPLKVRPLNAAFDLEAAKQPDNGPLTPVDSSQPRRLFVGLLDHARRDEHDSGGGNESAAHGRPDLDTNGGVALAVQTDVVTAALPANNASPATRRRAVEAPLDEFFLQSLPLWKRSLDLALAMSALVALAPLLFMVAVAVKLTSRGPVLFVQLRTGFGGQPFQVYKFRTMYEGAHDVQGELRQLSIQDGPAFKLVDDPRTTVIGKFLRATSIDELPQLWNVLRGDMSIVGPRPLPVAEAAECKPWQQRRHDVTPGLTCIWQVWGRSQVKFDDWIRMDLKYVDRISPAHDLKLIAATVPAVLARRGAS